MCVQGKKINDEGSKGEIEMAKCRICKGTGKESCPVCKGSGKDIRNPAKECGHCNGVGKVICADCKGSGEDPYDR